MKNQNNKSTDNEVKKEDLEILGKKTKHLRTDEGDDRILKNREEKVDFAGSDVDVPGRKLKHEGDPSKPKDEENQLYSKK